MIKGEVLEDLATNVKFASVKHASGGGWRIGLGTGGTNLSTNLLLPRTKAKHLWKKKT